MDVVGRALNSAPSRFLGGRVGFAPVSTLAHSSGRIQRLGARTIAGRASTCGWVLSDTRVSKEHTTLWWESGWRVRDLGSRNGTFVDGRRLAIGEVAELGTGSALGLGRTDEVWTLVDASPPHPCAVRVHDGAVQRLHGSLIALPSPEHPVVTVSRCATGWSIEEADGSRDITDGDLIHVAHEVWRLELPESLDATHEAETLMLGPLSRVKLRFRVSPDEEMVQVAASCDANDWQLQPRSYHYMLLTLARQRLSDRGAGVAADAEGWVLTRDLAHMLRTEERTLNVHVYRARRQLGDLGIDGAAGLIERRGRTGHMRLAIADVEVQRLG